MGDVHEEVREVLRRQATGEIQMLKDQLVKLQEYRARELQGKCLLCGSDDRADSVPYWLTFEDGTALEIRVCRCLIPWTSIQGWPSTWP